MRANVLIGFLCVSACTRQLNVATVYLATGEIGAGGGTVTVDAATSAVYAGTSITIPPQALSKTTLVTIGISASDGTPAGGISAGPAVAFGPDGTQFSTAATITLRYQLAAGTSRDELRVAAVESNGSRTIVGPGQLVVASSTLTFPVPGFTSFNPFTSSDSDGGSDAVDGGDATGTDAYGGFDGGTPSEPVSCSQAPWCDAAGGDVLQPAWTYIGPSQTLVFWGTFDAQGNQYSVACPPSFDPGAISNFTGAACDLVALGNTGTESWRLSGEIQYVRPGANVFGTVIGQTFLLVSQALSPMVQARSITDGSLLWSSNAVTPEPVLHAMAPVGGGAQLAIMGADIFTATGASTGTPSGVSLLEMSSGALLGTVSVPSNGGDALIASDGMASIWDLASSASNSLSLTNVTTASGALGQRSTGQLPMTPVVVDGTEAFSQASSLYASLGQLTVSNKSAWVWPNLVSGFPWSDTDSFQDVIIRDDGVAFVVAYPNESFLGGCTGTSVGRTSMFLDAYDVSSATRLFHCVIQSGLDGESALQLTAEHGVAFLTTDSTGLPAVVVTLGYGGTEFFSADLAGLPTGSTALRSAFIGTQWMVSGTTSGSNPTPFVVDYDLSPAAGSAAAAPHGWLSEGGGPSRTFAAQ